MKFKIELELDTNDDRELGADLIDLVSLLKQKLDEFNSESGEDWDEEEYEREEIEPEPEEPEPKPKRKRYRRRNK
tara:strand:- start:1010 stop:1234 length:225 start_codon:yes stop_codon:yes gene_type:complete